MRVGKNIEEKKQKPLWSNGLQSVQSCWNVSHSPNQKEKEEEREGKLKASIQFKRLLGENVTKSCKSYSKLAKKEDFDFLLECVVMYISGIKGTFIFQPTSSSSSSSSVKIRIGILWNICGPQLPIESIQSLRIHELQLL